MRIQSKFGPAHPGWICRQPWTMALALQSAALPESELDQMGCTLKSDLPHFYKALAERIANKAPVNIANIFSKCAEVIERDYFASNVEEMMLLVGDTQIQQVLTQAGGKATWKNILELVVGCKFKPSAQPSAQQLVPAAQPAVHNTLIPTFAISPLGAQMEGDGTLNDEYLPAYVLNAHSECEDPQEQELTALDVTAVLNAYTHYMLIKFNQPAGDKRLRVHHAQELRIHYPKLPAHGKTPGAARRWVNLLQERKRNFSRTSGLKARTRARALPAPLTTRTSPSKPYQPLSQSGQRRR